MRVRSLLIGSLLIVPAGAMAQRAVNDTVMKGTSIEVIQSYKPKVKQAPKPEWIPQLPPADTTHPAFDHDVPQQTLYYSYSSLPLRPLALGRDSLTLPFKNYVKLGGGNLSTLLLDAGIGGITGPGYETGIHIHHLSQKGDLKYQQTALSGIEADELLHRDNTEWHIGLAGERNQYYRYGFENTQSKDSLRQTYTSVKLGVDMMNKTDSTSKLLYHPAITGSYYNGAARANASETTIGLDAPFVYKFDPIVDAQLAVKGTVTNYSVAGLSISNNIFEVVPGIGIHSGSFSSHALVGFALGKASGVYVLPDLALSYISPVSKFGISAGWQASLRQNTYEQLTTENPYSSVYTAQQTRSDEVYLQMQGRAGDHFTYYGRLSWWSYDQLPTFLNNVAYPKQFDVIYDRVNAISFQAGARYQVANNWSAGATASYFGFYNGSLPYVWHEPGMKIKADFMAHLFPKFTVTAYLALLDGIHAQDPLGHTVKLSPIAEAGLNVEYQVIPRLSLFAQVNNLFNDKYQRWYGYEVYGLNVFGGLRFKF